LQFFEITASQSLQPKNTRKSGTDPQSRNYSTLAITPLSRCRGCDPIASRMPNSRVRALTENANTPATPTTARVSHANFEGIVGDVTIVSHSWARSADEGMYASLSEPENKKTLNTLCLESIPTSRLIVPPIGWACRPGIVVTLPGSAEDALPGRLRRAAQGTPGADGQTAEESSSKRRTATPTVAIGCRKFAAQITVTTTLHIA
jgi:hypothetical protein